MRGVTSSQQAGPCCCHDCNLGLSKLRFTGSAPCFTWFRVCSDCDSGQAAERACEQQDMGAKRARLTSFLLALHAVPDAHLTVNRA